MLKKWLYKRLLRKKHEVLRLEWERIALQAKIKELKRGMVE